MKCDLVRLAGGSVRGARAHRFALLLAALLVSARAGHAEAPATPGSQYRDGDVLVGFQAGVDLAEARRVLADHGLEFAIHYGFLSRQSGREYGLVRAPGRATADLITELSLESAIAVAEPNYYRWVCAHPPNDPYFSQLWGLQNTGQSANGLLGSSGADIRFLPAWSMALVSTNPVVAVVDTGVDYTHPDLAPNMWVNTGEIPNNQLDDDGNGYVDDVYGYDFAAGNGDPQDSGFHGTHLSGTIAAVGNNQLGVVGVNYQARVMALRISNDGSSMLTSAEIEAYQYAAMMVGRGVKVVAANASFGGGSYSSTEMAAIQGLGAAGIILCAAAGNNSSDNDTSPFYPAAYHLPNMIVVAATDQNDALASFSNYGAATVDLAAPGVNILSTQPLAQGQATYVQQGATTYLAHPMSYSGSTAGVTGPMIDCGLGYPGNFPSGAAGYIALISRGTLTFAVKASNAMAAGAAAVLVYNATNGNFNGTLGTSGNWVPTLSLGLSDGLALKAALPTTATVVNTPNPNYAYQFLDGTSMASPHVAGAVAFAAMNFPGETVAQRIERVTANAHSVAGLSGLVRTGARLDLLRMVDTDGNGLPDWWEQRYFGHGTGTDPNADPDGDHANNLAEWLAGTNPTNAASCLRLTAALTATNTVKLQWPSAAGRFYRVLASTNLAAGFNLLVQTNIPAAPPANTLTPPATAGGQRFYRLELEL